MWRINNPCISLAHSKQDRMVTALLPRAVEISSHKRVAGRAKPPYYRADQVPGGVCVCGGGCWHTAAPPSEMELER